MHRTGQHKNHTLISWSIPLLLACLCPMLPLTSKQFGVQGTLFTIEEEHLVTVLHKRLSSLDGDAIKQRFAAVQEQVKHFPALVPLPRARSPRLFYCDPTYIAPETLKDAQGNVLVLKGTRMNPLSHTPLSTGLLFFDGDNPDHVQWAKDQQGPFKWILVQGNPFELEMQEQRPVYFDQNGFSTKKLGLQQIPARVTQEGLRLKIEEIVLTEPQR